MHRGPARLPAIARRLRKGPYQVAVIPEDDSLHRQSQLKIAVRADARPGSLRVTCTQGKEPTEGIGE